MKTLEYRPPDPPRPLPAVLFWVVHICAAIAGSLVVEPTLHTALYGRPGDTGVATFTLLSMLLVLMAMIPLYQARLRKQPPLLSLAIAATAGLLCWVPGYLAMFLMF